MRIIMAALASCLSGAAWAGVDHETPRARNCDVLAGGEYVDADEITATVEAALKGALGALAAAELDEETLAHVEAEIDAAMDDVEVELAAYDGRRSISDAEEAALEARLEAVMERVEEAMERASDRLEEAHERTESKRWRPRY